MATEELRLRDPAQACADHPTIRVADRKGDAYCFNCIIVALQDQCFRVACRILNDRHLAEDAVQESLASAYRSFGQFRGDNLRGWLLRIVSNSCKDALRSIRSRPTVPLDPVTADPEEDAAVLSATDLPSGQESPEDFTLRSELRRTIDLGLAALSEERRMAIVLVDVEGFSYEEASTALGCSVGTIKSRISRGRRELRDYLRACGELLPSSFRQEQ